MNNKKLGWIGLGSMGLAMAKNVQRALRNRSGHPLKYFNRTMSKGEPLKELGAIPGHSIADVVESSDIVFISMSDDNAVRSVVAQVSQMNAGSQSKTLVDTTTVHPLTSKSMAENLAANGTSYVSAPVFGPTPTAEAGKLLVALAGPQQETSIIAPLLKQTFARDVIVVSESPEKALLLKTMGNFVVAGVMEIIAEGHVFAEKSGLGTETFEKLLELNFGDLAYMDSKRLSEGKYMPPKGQSPWSDLNLALKDVGYGIDCAAEVGTRLKVGEVALDHLKRAKQYSVAQGDRPLDSSSMYGVIREDAGLDFKTDLVNSRDL